MRIGSRIVYEDFQVWKVIDMLGNTFVIQNVNTKAVKRVSRKRLDAWVFGFEEEPEWEQLCLWE